MFDLRVNDEQKKYVTNILKNVNLGNRGIGDGNYDEQFVGFLGQVVFADYIGVSRPDGSGGFDDGVDFIINNKKVDLKTMGRTVPVRDYFVHNFIGYQKDYDVDFYIFASYNKRTSILTICGSVSKNEFFEKANFFAKGDKRYRSDGSYFINKAPLYEFTQSDFVVIKNIDDIKKIIK